MIRINRFFALLVGGLICSKIPALAVDHNNIDAGRPLSFDDAEAVAYHELSFETGGTLVIPHKKSAGAEGAMEALYGFAPNTHASVDWDPTGGGRSGSEEKRFDVGDVGIGVLHNFNRQIKNIPAFAVRGDVFLPTGRARQGTDGRVRAIMSKTLTQYDRVHLNLESTFRSSPEAGERDVLPAAILGYSKPIGYPRVFTRTGMAEIGVRQADRIGEGPIMSVGIGLRQQLTVRSVMDVGVQSDVIGGRSAARDDVRIIAGYSIGF